MPYASIYYGFYYVEFKCHDYVIVRLCLRYNGMGLVMKYICALLWYNDVNVLIARMRVVMKGVLIQFWFIYDYDYIRGRPYNINKVMSINERHF